MEELRRPLKNQKKEDEGSFTCSTYLLHNINRLSLYYMYKWGG